MSILGIVFLPVRLAIGAAKAVLHTAFGLLGLLLNPFMLVILAILAVVMLW